MTTATFSGNFFELAASAPSGFTPFLNGDLQDPNPFELQYDMSLSHETSDTTDMQDVSWNTIAAESDVVISQSRGTSFSSDGSDTSPTSVEESPTETKPSAERVTKRTKNVSRADGLKLAEGGGDMKRNKFLARNRLAASKCRTKKKEWTNNLEAAARQASLQSRELQAIVQRLRDEVVEYKTQLMSHHGCECEQIKQYIQMEQSKSYNSAASQYQMDMTHTRMN